MIRCIIIDPDANSRKNTSRMLSRYDDFSIIGIYSHPDEVPYTIDKTTVDVLFIEVVFSRLYGLDYIRSLSNAPLTVITTSYREYAVECFELDILDYLIKPLEPSRLSTTISRIKRAIKASKTTTSQSSKNEDFIFIRAEKRRIKIQYDSLLYIESIKDYISIHTTSGEYIIHQTLSGFTALLPHSRFIRCHRSYTVNIEHIEAIHASSIIIAGKTIPIGRMYMTQVREKIL
ncbi:MAG: response regulator transcription factor [Flavobacteriales bacterium]|nr:response regulator transcription factor [Flavobacteriales bacterium]